MLLSDFLTNCETEATLWVSTQLWYGICSINIKMTPSVELS